MMLHGTNLVGLNATDPEKVAYVAAQLREHVREAVVDVHAPSGKGQVWWIDVSLRDHSVVIQFSKEDGFGLSTPTEDDYGSAANEVYADADEAVARTIQLLKHREKVRARREMHLSPLRW